MRTPLLINLARFCVIIYKCTKLVLLELFCTITVTYKNKAFVCSLASFTNAWFGLVYRYLNNTVRVVVAQSHYISERELALFVPPFGDLRVMYTVHLWLVGKRVVDFLLMIIELFVASSDGRGAMNGYWSKLWFLPARRNRCACLSVCVCVSVCVSHAGIVSKRLNVGSKFCTRLHE